jgi:MFS transporter, UMF1 family
MNYRKLLLWSLYDFANSIVFINFILYFSQWLVLDGGLSDFNYNAIFAITTIFLLFSAPALAAYTDRCGGRKKFLNGATIGTAASYGLAALLAHSSHPQILVVALFFLLGQYFYQLSFVFYNPFLQEVADEAHRSRASGIGQFANYAGQICGIFITLPLSGSRLAPLLPAVALFFILALPMLIFYRENASTHITLKSSGDSLTLKKRALKFALGSAATPFLISFFFFNDALITVSNNYSLYLARVFAVDDSNKSLLLAAILASSAIGGIIAGWLADRIGQLKALKLILVGWAISLPLLALTPNFELFKFLTILVGLLLGAIWTVSRAYLSSLLAPNEVGFGFSFYTLFERLSTFVGPLTWGGIVTLYGPSPQTLRWAMGLMTIYVVIGLLVLCKGQRRQVLCDVEG